MLISYKTTHEILRAFSRYYDVNLLKTKMHRKPVVACRSAAMYVLRKNFQFSSPDLARIFDCDHTTVLAACERVLKNLQVQAGLADELRMLEEIARGILATKERGMRKKLPDERSGHTLHFVITTKHPTVEGQTAEVDGYLTTGLFEDGRLGEIFIKVGKSGEAAALLDSWATLFSYALQYGAPLELLCNKEINKQFEPCGPTNVPGIARCTSPVDLVCRWLLQKYGVQQLPQPEVEQLEELGDAQ